MKEMPHHITDKRDASSHNRRKICLDPLQLKKIPHPLQLQGMAYPITIKETSHPITDEIYVLIH